MRILSSEISKHEGKEIMMAGWVDARRDHGKLIFIDLRDRSGLTQVVFNAKNEEVYEQANKLRPEWVIEIKGEVKARPENMINEDIESGKHELSVTELKVLTESETPPISIEGDGYEIGEENRIKYRYLDLRRKRLSDNFKNKSKIFSFIRNHLTGLDFTEVETPILGKSTPEGARDYLVPSRLQAGKFYALPQSPQQYKQLLMIAGLERYFQIVRCFRDEDTRGDRQPEFTQLDLEMSFVEEKDVLDLTEEMLLKMFKEFYPERKVTLDQDGRIPRMSFKDAMEKHNTDKPDVRENKDDPNELAPLIVTNFPAFEYKEGDKRWGAVHHPFTMPKVESVQELKDKFKEDPASIESYQYDIVLNGFEIAGGSIRTHDPEMLSTVFQLLGHSEQEVEEKFGHLLEAFKYGVPPHGGIAFGLDRLFAILFKEPNIREVIAFPKTGDGRDLMTGAPAEVSEDQLKELHIKINKKQKNE
ncbi:MAG: aspartate--tRNA ligase [Candidatus Paceibacterota bacterium]